MSYCIVCSDPSAGLVFCKPCTRAWDADARRDETMYAAVRWAARRARRMARRHPKPHARAALDRRVVELLRKLADRPEGYAVAFSEDARALLAEMKETPHA